MTDAEIRLPAEAHDRLTAMAATERLSLRAYLVRLAGMALPPTGGGEQACTALAALKAWNGYDPSPEQAEALDAELGRRVAEAVTG
ncbi:hypothetical protein ACFXDE_12955 [Kitasatospora sp. NPDC059408]|uniref:hypothetical protein n=1 Tax=Kitasatospora sp. NPDC059408 TaxID=3346823 RepID=UPI0036C6EDCE